MLDDDLRAGRLGHGEEGFREQAGGERAPVEEDVQIARAFHPHLARHGQRGKRGTDLLGDVAGLSFQSFGEMQGGRKRQVSELPAGRNLDDGVVVEPVKVPNGPGNRPGQLTLEGQEHRGRQSSKRPPLLIGVQGLI